MKKRIISIAGDLGSGKTTVTKLMQRDLGYEIAAKFLNLSDLW